MRRQAPEKMRKITPRIVVLADPRLSGSHLFVK
jgi:hypothetical protein